MRSKAECVPCILLQGLRALRAAGMPEGRVVAVLQGAAPLLGEFDPSRSPAENSSLVIHKIYEMAGQADPFLEYKRRANAGALRLARRVKQRIEDSKNPLLWALKFSAAGNVADAGILPGYDLEGALEEALSRPWAIDDYPRFRQALGRPAHVLIIGDNSGEIAFDRLLAEKLSKAGHSVTYAVKGGPILNDVTREDAAAVGMHEVARVVDTGNNFLGVLPARSSEEFLEVLEAADVVISKGQANYESLDDEPLCRDRCFFLLTAKCGVVAGSLGVKVGDLVFALSPSAPGARP